MSCPICNKDGAVPYADTPYLRCPYCEVMYQAELPPKLWHGAHEDGPDQMSERDKQINAAMAGWIFKDWLLSRPGRTLDIGGGFPQLAHELGVLGCEAFAIDGEIYPFDGMKCRLIKGDFEQELPAELTTERFRLITLIHTFEHFYHPLDVLAKLRDLLADDGYLFIRLPDNKVKGFERDLTPGHFTIHPFYHCLTSLLQCLVEVTNCFEVAWTSQLEPGQRDLVLRPIKRRPLLGLSMIVKNEARDLPRCLASVGTIIDNAVIVDTGSIDGTIAVANKALRGVKRKVTRYLEASEKDATGDWKLWDFSKARNFSLERLEATGVDWIMWMDADDELINPEVIQRAIYMPADTFSLIVQDGAMEWQHQRIWRARAKVRFHRRCHEYAEIGGLTSAPINAKVIHRANPDPLQENSNERNVRILMRDWEELHDERTAFYLGDTHRHGGRFNEAVDWYRKRLAFGPQQFRDEYLFARLYLARCLLMLKQQDEALNELLLGSREAPDWMEFTMDRAWLEYYRGAYETARVTAMVALDKPVPFSPLWREPSAYTDGPARLISWSYEQRGQLADALVWAAIAAEKIPFDQPWADRIARIRQAYAERERREGRGPVPLVPSAAVARRVTALVRRGAIGDILMTMNLIPAFKAAHPDIEVTYVCSDAYAEPRQLGNLIRQAGATPLGISQAHVADFERWIELVGYPVHEGYPEQPMRRHLLNYFADELGLAQGATDLLALELPLPVLATASGYFTVQTRAGWSPYKQWPLERWQQALKQVEDKTGLRPVWLSPETTPDLADAIAIFAHARFHVGIDSFANHLTHYIWINGREARRVRGVILWGSTQVEAAGYTTNINVHHRLWCGPCFREDPAISQMSRGPCINPPGQVISDPRHECMNKISVDEVVTAILQLDKETHGMHE